MLSIPVLAAGVVGTLLGGVVIHFRRRAEPVISTKLAREIVATLRSDLAEAIVDRDLAHRDAVEAQSATAILAAQRDEARAAMFVAAQKLSDEQRDHAATKLRLERTEQELADVHLKLARMRAAEEERADAEAMGLGEAA